MGVLVDPYNTSPTSGRSAGFLQKLHSRFLPSSSQQQPEPPLAALTPWQDVGECWCSKPRSGMSQLALHLGREIVPEEVVIEHIPKGASISQSLAHLRDIVWGAFSAQPHHRYPAVGIQRWTRGCILERRTPGTFVLSRRTVDLRSPCLEPYPEVWVRCYHWCSSDPGKQSGLPGQVELGWKRYMSVSVETIWPHIGDQAYISDIFIFFFLGVFLF